MVGGTSQVGKAAHNAYISILVELGVVGLGLFCLILLCCLYDIWKMPLNERVIWIMLFSAWAAAVYSLSWEYCKATWFMFGMIAAQYGSLQNWKKTLPAAGAGKKR
jgi:O-antigen ligase